MGGYPGAGENAKKEGQRLCEKANFLKVSFKKDDKENADAVYQVSVAANRKTYEELKAEYMERLNNG